MANQIGFPIMIKATAGGGGRGMRLAQNEDEFLPLMRQAQQEAEAAFGNGNVYLERFVKDPRHIEFQVGGCSGDGGCTRHGQGLATAACRARWRGGVVGGGLWQAIPV